MPAPLIADWLAGWSEEQIAGLATVGRPMLGSAIAQGLANGFKVTQMYDSMRLAGVGMRKQNFLDAARAVGASREAHAIGSALDLNAVPTASKVMSLEFGTLSGLVHRVDITATRTIDGIREQFTTRTFVRTNEPLTVQDAIAQAKSIFDNLFRNEMYDSQQFLFAQYAGVINQVPRKTA